ncbi:MAG: gliding motility-associated C-terminal domain-containing protein [Chitinophagales bacterium]
MTSHYFSKIIWLSFLIWIFSAICVTSPSIFAKNQAPLYQNKYVEGKLYVEVKARYQSMNWEYDEALDKPKNHGLKRWILQYQVTKIEKLTTDKAKNAYFFYFKKSNLTTSFLQTLSNLPYIEKATQIPNTTLAEHNLYTSSDLASHKPNSVLIPNAFSPNSDQSNDYFEVKGQNLLAYELQIINRLGESICKVNETNTYGWDGTIKGKEVPVGIYAYYGWVRFEDGETKILKGYLTLIK